MSKLLCFKPTRNVHDSGYRIIEYGYIEEERDELGNEQIEIIGRYDVLDTPYVEMPIRIDLTRSGWFRIMPKKGLELEWQYGGSISIKAKS